MTSIARDNDQIVPSKLRSGRDRPLAEPVGLVGTGHSARAARGRHYL